LHFESLNRRNRSPANQFKLFYATELSAEWAHYKSFPCYRRWKWGSFQLVSRESPIFAHSLSKVYGRNECDECVSFQTAFIDLSAQKNDRSSPESVRSFSF